MNTSSFKINALLLSNLLCWGILTIILFSGFDNKKRKRFSEIDAEKINILGVNGKPIMVLSNKQHIPGPSINGKTYPREFADGREHFSGIIFFNEDGDEVGGLIYTGIKKDSGYYAMEHLSFDQWKQNQVVAMQYIDNGKSRRAGVRIWDRPTNVSMDQLFDRFMTRNRLEKGSPAFDSITREIKASSDRGDNGVERLFIGSQDQVAQIQLRDNQGRIRARLYVNELGEGQLDFLDEKGKLIGKVPAKN